MPVDQYGRVIRSAPAPRVNFPIRQSSTSSFNYNSTASRSSYRSYSDPWYQRAWEGFDDVITSIGNFIAEHGFAYAGYATAIAGGLLFIGLVIWVIQAWINEGFLWAILYAIGATIIFGIGAFFIGIASYILQLAVAAVRLVFWAGWSFLLCLIGALGFWWYNASDSGNSNYADDSAYESYEEEVEVAYPFRCTASVLNIRTSPDSYSNVIGVLHRGEQVDVYEIVNGFAQIRFNGQNGYVSLDYLDPMQ